MFRENRDFYPTPKSLFDKLTEGINFQTKSMVLEPSAGNGGMVEMISSKRGHYLSKVHSIEFDENLIPLLREKNTKVVHNDFLTFEPIFRYDYIIMNPPFSNGVHHLHKAIEISNGTEIRCVLNAETIRNPNSVDRQLLLQLLAKYKSSVDYHKDEFITEETERKTSVEVAIVKISIPRRESEFEFKPQFDTEKHSFDNNNIFGGGVATKDELGNLVHSYDSSIEALKEVFKAINKLDHHLGQFGGGNAVNLMKTLSDSGESGFAQVQSDIRENAWQNVFQSSKIGSLLTREARERFNEAREHQSYMSFTRDNLYNCYNDIVSNFEGIMKSCVVESFEKLTKHTIDNRMVKEGWKTNEKWFINRKVIFPLNWTYDKPSTWFGDKAPYIEHHARELLTDLEKACAYLSGEKYDFVNKDYIADTWDDFRNNHNINESIGKWHKSKYFEFRLYKKGTIHLKFLTKELWDNFNRVACEGKMWLGYENG